MQNETQFAAKWGSEGFFFTEAARGGPFGWPVGESKLEGDALGPVRHAHDDAAEYYVMFSGSAQVECGGEEFVLEEGELGYIPPDVPHNFLGPAGDREACLFCVVSPNFADNKWRVRDFKPEAESLRMEVARPFEDETLPGDDKLTATAISLAPDAEAIVLTPSGSEIVYLVLEGSVQIHLANGLGGSVAAGSYVHVRDEVRHELRPDGAGKVLRMDCSFVAWEGVPTGEHAA